MIRRLILYRPITPEEAAAATKWSRSLGDERLTIEYRPAPVAMRVLLFDGVTQKNERGWDMLRKVRVRRIDDPAAAASAALRSAMGAGEAVFNVFTGLSPDGAAAYPGTDAVFTVAFPTGDAVAFFRRVAGGVAPGIAVGCIAPVFANWASERFIPLDKWRLLYNSVRYLFFKRPPPQIRQHEDRVMAMARGLLAEVP